MTLHAAKGLEFSNVFIIAVEENILPHARSQGEPSQVEEERRLLFVGITRAKNNLQLSYAKSRGFGGSSGTGVPSSFLLELPRSEMQILDHTGLQAGADFMDDPSELSDYFDNSHPDLDQFEQCSDDQDVLVEYDEHCQLPPEEAQQRHLKKAQKSLKGKISLGSQLTNNRPDWGRFRVGAVVRHPDLGSGEIITCSGHGPKRSVTVFFFDSSREVTYRLSHAPLELQ